MPGGVSPREANILAASRALPAHEVVTILVGAASPTWRCAESAAARAASGALKFGSVLVHALHRPRIPPGTLRVLGHRIVDALGKAALATWSLARIAAAFVAMSADEVVLCVLAAHTPWAHTNVSAAGAACPTQEIVPIGVGASNRLARARSVLGNGILVANLALVAALAAWRSASVSTATPTFLAGEGMPQRVLAAEVALGLAGISAALALAAREGMPLAVKA